MRDMTPASLAIEIPRNERTDPQGNAVSAEMVVSCVNLKMAFPTASQAMIAAHVNSVDPSYVSRALRTPYAIKALATLKANPFQKAIATASGDSLVYVHKATLKATTALDDDAPNPALLTAANQAANTLLKATVLPSRIEVAHRDIDPKAYTGLDELDGLMGQEADQGTPGSCHDGERLRGHTSDEDSDS